MSREITFAEDGGFELPIAFLQLDAPYAKSQLLGAFQFIKYTARAFKVDRRASRGTHNRTHGHSSNLETLLRPERPLKVNFWPLRCTCGVRGNRREVP